MRAGPPPAPPASARRGPGRWPAGRVRVGLVGLATGLALVSACGSAGTGTDTPARGRLTVFAAASLTEAFRDVGEAFEADRPGVEVSFNFAGSSILATQVAETTAADVFASADPAQMARARRARRVAEPAVFATNRMVVVVPAANPAAVDEPSDLRREGTAVVLGAPAVPAGAYARQTLRHRGLWRRVEPNVVSNEEDVKQVLAKVAAASADAGIVYRSDVTAEVADEVTVVELDAPVEARYLIAATTTSERPELARAFVEYVRRRGGPFLRRAGFGTPAAAASGSPPAAASAAPAAAASGSPAS